MLVPHILVAVLGSRGSEENAGCTYVSALALPHAYAEGGQVADMDDQDMCA